MNRRELRDSREARVYTSATTHSRAYGFNRMNEVEVTDPVRRRPATMSRAEWRELMRKGRKVVKKHERQARREEAATPESVKIDRRIHAAGLVSPRDMGRVIPVEYKILGV